MSPSLFFVILLNKKLFCIIFDTIEFTIFAFSMKKTTIDKMLPKLRVALAKQPIKRAWLFGSYSRGEETPKSDVDILVQYDEQARISLLTISRIMIELSEAIGRPVDLVEDGRLLPFANESVNHDKILIYERAS